MKHYLRNDFPIKINCPMLGDIEISEQEYKRICKERNDKIAEDQAKQEEEMRPILEQKKRIQAKIEELALQELGEEKL